jgi:hypothetical protein
MGGRIVFKGKRAVDPVEVMIGELQTRTIPLEGHEKHCDTIYGNLKRLIGSIASRVESVEVTKNGVSFKGKGDKVNRNIQVTGTFQRPKLDGFKMGKAYSDKPRNMEDDEKMVIGFLDAMRQEKKLRRDTVLPVSIIRSGVVYGYTELFGEKANLSHKRIGAILQGLELVAERTKVDGETSYKIRLNKLVQHAKKCFSGEEETNGECEETVNCGEK